MIKLLIVDDSALMRKHMIRIFQEEGDFAVQACRNGKEALQELHTFQPDVISLDINMPEMDGLTCLSRIMVERPCPVVMVSSLTEKGALATFEALALGALDYVPKPSGTISLSLDEISVRLVSKIRAAAKAKIRTARGLRERLKTTTRIESQSSRAVTSRDHSGHSSSMREAVDRVVIIGVSTGGPSTLEEILPYLPADFPMPIVVAQHMPATFTAAFAQRMDSLCALEVSEVAKPTLIQAGKVYIGRGDADVVLSNRPNGITAIPRPADPKYLWHPSVDCLMSSALDLFVPKNLIGVLLTGMGYDGAETMAQLYQQGGRTVAESEETAIVFGMPAELIRRGGASAVLPCNRIAEQLIRWMSRQ